MEKRKKIIPVLLVLVFFSFNTYFSVYATEDIPDHSELSAATPSEADKNESSIQEFSRTFTVAFDPDDGVTTYENFFKVTVSEGSLIPAKPSTPKRDGYIFKGWYGYLDENYEPVLWNFKTDIIEENTTLWAFWEKACLVAFDPDDGVSTYNDFYKVTVPVGSLITAKPSIPKRDGYIFKGWYSYLDNTEEPVFWNFDTDTVPHNITLWAAWNKDKETETSGGGNENENSNGNETPHKGGSGGSSSSSKSKGGPTPVEPQTSEEESIDLEEQNIVTSKDTLLPKANMIGSNNLDPMPKTGSLDILRYGITTSLSLILLPVLLFRRKREQ